MNKSNNLESEGIALKTNLHLYLKTKKKKTKQGHGHMGKERILEKLRNQIRLSWIILLIN